MADRCDVFRRVSSAVGFESKLLGAGRETLWAGTRQVGVAHHHYPQTPQTLRQIVQLSTTLWSETVEEPAVE